MFVKRQQARFFKEKIEHLTEEEAVVQVDFAENYSCKYQGKVQSAHWSQDQVTLFTVAIWAKSRDKNSCCESHVIVSDDLKHDQTSFAVFMRKVVNDLVKGRPAKHNSSLDIFRWTKLAVQEQVGTLPIFSIYFKVKVLTSSGTTLPHHMGKGLLMVSGEL